jgi:hypothetical protein
MGDERQATSRSNVEARRIVVSEPAPPVNRPDASNGKLEENFPTLRQVGRSLSIASLQTAAQHIHLPHPHLNPEAHDLARAEAASWAQMTPLVAATLGPLSVLLGIPTLTQPWEGVVLNPPLLASGASNYTALPFPTVNIILGAFSFACEVLGNAFLILRFSNYHTKVTTWLSFGFWIAKMVFALVNYIQFGVTHPETVDTIYLQGFWVQCIASHNPNSTGRRVQYGNHGHYYPLLGLQSRFPS